MRLRMRLAPVLGYSRRQLQRWWGVYPQGGLAACWSGAAPGGSRERITPMADRDGLAGARGVQMRAGRIAGLKPAQRLLRERFSIPYTMDDQ